MTRTPSPVERVDLECRVAAQVDAVVATCRDEVDELARMGVPTDHVHVVPCGVDTEHFTPADAGQQPPALPSSGRPRLLAVGRLVERKGFDLAVRALAELPEAELVVVGGPPADRLGDDPEARRLRSLAAELGVEDRLLLTGQWPHADLPALYRSADVVLAVPWYEPFGITPLEAAACGRPLVGTAVGGLLDSVEDGVTGLLVPPRDVPALAAAVRRLLEDPETAAAMGARARARAVERFDWSVVAARTEAVLDATARGRAPASGLSWLDEHALEVERGMRSLVRQADLIRSWGERLATSLVAGGRLLAAGNGGSAAEAQHLTAELVGRWCTDRRPLSAISLCAETSSLTAILNDYGPDEVFARQVEAHGRPGDVLVLLSTSGTSSNVLHAAKRALDIGMRVWAMTGPGPNPLAGLATEVRRRRRADHGRRPGGAARRHPRRVRGPRRRARSGGASWRPAPSAGRPRERAPARRRRRRLPPRPRRRRPGRPGVPRRPGAGRRRRERVVGPRRCGPHGAPVRRRRRRRHPRRAARRRRRGT